MLPVETLEVVLFFLSRNDLELVQNTNRYFRNVIANEAFACRAALRLVPRMRLLAEATGDIGHARDFKQYALNADELPRWVRNTCVEHLDVDARLPSAVGWYLTHRRQVVAIAVRVILPFASDELQRTFFHEAAGASWSSFSMDYPGNVSRSRTIRLPLMSPSLRSCGSVYPCEATWISAKDLFGWIGQPREMSSERRFMCLSYDGVDFEDQEDGLIVHLHAMREEFQLAATANPYYINFRDVPLSILDRKGEFEDRKCNRTTIEYFEILVDGLSVTICRRPLF